MFKKVDPRQNFPEMEKDIMNFWKKDKIFERSVENRSDEKTYSFFDGPPFATGMPHYGHVVANLMKDVVPRYWTMRGYKVERRWGWDCHGLPIENLIEKEHNIKNKQEIEDMGVDKFNEACCDSVLRYAKEWKKFIPRIGRWVDMENDYRTMDWKYTESIWWVFSELYKKGLVYEGYKSMHICPRCETTLSNFEVTQGYKDITDLSAVVKFKLKKESAKRLRGILRLASLAQDDNAVSNSECSDSEMKNPDTAREMTGSFAKAQDDNVYVLAWTTTPWTLPGNVALAVGEDVEYLYIEVETSDVSEIKKGEAFIIANTTETEIRVFGNKLDYHENYAEANVNFQGKGNVLFKNIKVLKGKEIVGLEYESLFDYYSKKEDLENKENGWKIYAGDFVSTEEGTGIVHIAPAFGDDDMKLAEKHNLPFVQHVGMDGRFKDEVVDFRERNLVSGIRNQVSEKGQEVKPKRNSRETDEKIVKFLEGKETKLPIGSLVSTASKIFSKENYKHSYPHCWRCDTPLLNYATSSWFVKVTEIKDQMVKNNKQVNWTPEYIKEGRFGKWLEDARDWAVSRSRYWGAPLPVWRCEDCKNIEVINSIDDLREKTDQKITKFILLRHGESESNVKNIKAGQLEGFPLTEKGIKQSKDAAEILKKERVDIVVSSPVLRTKQTAEIVSKELGIEYIENERIKEYDFGSWNGHGSDDSFCKEDELYQEYKKLAHDDQKYNFHFGGDGESRKEIEERVRKFIEEVTEKYAGKNILIVGHGGINAMFHRIIKNTSIEDTYKYEFTLGNAKQNIFYMDENKKEFNLHKPNIDKIEIKCSKCGDEAKIVGDVFDCWFESGSMPYAQWHYPFENREEFEKSFPAEFIAEGLDQTRGWFYTLMVLSTALFDKAPFGNVIVNGMVLAENGQKMSKRLKNYPEPNLVIEKYGADALRYYLLSSPVMKGESLRFSEKGVEEVLKKFILTLWNTYSFLVMNSDGQPSPVLSHRERDVAEHPNKNGKAVFENKSSNLLDSWIISEFNILIGEVNKQMENYDLVRASRPMREFIDKLSNWYVRRSRKRFSVVGTRHCLVPTEDRDFAFQTLHYVLTEYAKLLAPFMPFLSEEIYQNLTDKESVHLEDFPVADKSLINEKVSNEMNFVRDVVSLGLAIRAKNGLKVRQPLSELRIMNHELRNFAPLLKKGARGILEMDVDDELIELIKDELNVKEVKFVDDLQKGSTQENGVSNWIIEEGVNIKIALNVEITEELKLEGQAREIVRHIQVMRKEAKYDRDDVISVKYSFVGENKDTKKVFEEWGDYIKKECLTKNVEFVDELAEEDFDLVKELKIGDYIMKVGIVKV